MKVKTIKDFSENWRKTPKARMGPRFLRLSD